MNSKVPPPTATVTAITIHRPGMTLFGDTLTLRLEDHAGGPFTVLTSNKTEGDRDEVYVDFDEWEVLARAAETLRESAKSFEGGNE